MAILLALAGRGSLVYADINSAVEIPTEVPVSNFGSEDYAFNLPSGTLEDPDIKLVRGNTYTFIANFPPNHPFFIKDAATDLDAVGVSGQGGSNSARIVIEVTDATPDLLYYICGIHDEMRGNVYVVDAEGKAVSKLVPTPLWGLPILAGGLAWAGIHARKRR